MLKKQQKQFIIMYVLLIQWKIENILKFQAARDNNSRLQNTENKYL